MSKKTHRDRYAKLDALYAQLPRIACRGLCTACCGPIPMSTVEADRMRRAHPEHLTGRTTDNHACGYLTAGGRCSVYAVRPLICRVFGVVKRMSCQHGCEPDRWLSDREFLLIAQSIERLGAPLVVTTEHGLVPLQDSFLLIPVPTEDEMGRLEHYSDLTRGLRALNGGRIIGLAPTPHGEPGGFVDVDALRRQRQAKNG